jgi:hypothetical protein
VNNLIEINYHTKIMLGDFNAQIGREAIFKPTIGNEICTKLVTIMALE